MPLLITSDHFRVGLLAQPLQLPEGWTLRESQYDYPAAISPAHVEWIISKDGTLHEAKTTALTQRILTGNTLCLHS